MDWPFFDAAHRALAASVTTWLASAPAIPAGGGGATAADEPCREWVRRLGSAGFLRYCVPAAWGGALAGVESRSLCVLREALAGHDALADFAFAMQGLGSGPITLGGSDALRADWLPRVARGEAIAAFALSEPEAGSDAAALRTTATRRPGGWRLDGTKTWISNGGIADFYCVFARTDPAAAPSKGIGAFVVPAATPGLRVAERLAVMAPHPLATLALDGCLVPDEFRLGDPGDASRDPVRLRHGTALLGRVVQKRIFKTPDGSEPEGRLSILSGSFRHGMECVPGSMGRSVSARGRDRRVVAVLALELGVELVAEATARRGAPGLRVRVDAIVRDAVPHGLVEALLLALGALAEHLDDLGILRIVRRMMLVHEHLGRELAGLGAEADVGEEAGNAILRGRAHHVHGSAAVRVGPDVAVLPERALQHLLFEGPRELQADPLVREEQNGARGVLPDLHGAVRLRCGRMRLLELADLDAAQVGELERVRFVQKRLELLLMVVLVEDSLDRELSEERELHLPFEELIDLLLRLALVPLGVARGLAQPLDLDEAEPDRDERGDDGGHHGVVGPLGVEELSAGVVDAFAHLLEAGALELLRPGLLQALGDLGGHELLAPNDAVVLGLLTRLALRLELVEHLGLALEDLVLLEEVLGILPPLLEEAVGLDAVLRVVGEPDHVVLRSDVLGGHGPPPSQIVMEPANRLRRLFQAAVQRLDSAL
ncbi:hypothetical protein EDM68_02445 [Candidatus Uhrbacteria bacterium]|nr:MAG: hypothetical protein EDM68_02445 [Candidatus Uhrbacteria bacterium]